MMIFLDPSEPVSTEVARDLADRMMAPGYSDADARNFVDDEVAQMATSDDPAVRQMARLYALGFRKAFFDWAAQYDSSDGLVPATMVVALAKANAHFLAELVAGLEVPAETQRRTLEIALKTVVHDSRAMLEGFTAAAELTRRGDS